MQRVYIGKSVKVHATGFKEQLLNCSLTEDDTTFRLVFIQYHAAEMWFTSVTVIQHQWNYMLYKLHMNACAYHKQQKFQSTKL